MKSQYSEMIRFGDYIENLKSLKFISVEGKQGELKEVYGGFLVAFSSTLKEIVFHFSPDNKGLNIRKITSLPYSDFYEMNVHKRYNKVYFLDRNEALKFILHHRGIDFTSNLSEIEALDKVYLSKLV